MHYRPLKLVVAKLWNSDPAGFEGDGGFGSESLYAMEPRTDLPLLPIDPASWVEASRIATLNGSALSPAVTSDEGSEIGQSPSLRKTLLCRYAADHFML